MTSAVAGQSDEYRMEPTILTDGLVTLRALTPQDVPAIVEQCQDPETIRFTAIPQPYGSEQGMEFVTRCAADWRSGDPGAPRTWAIESPDEHGIPRYAGSCDYRPDGPACANRDGHNEHDEHGEHGEHDDRHGQGGQHGRNGPDGRKASDARKAWDDGEAPRTALVGFVLHPWARGRGLAARALRLMSEHAFASGVEVLIWRAYEGNWASRRAAWRCGFVIEGRVRGGLPARPGQPARVAWFGSLHRDDPRRPPHAWHRTPTLTAQLGTPERPRGITLRPWRDDDTVPASTDPASDRFLPGLVPTTASFPAWLAERRERQAQGERVEWCIADAHDGALGSVGLFGLDRLLRDGSAKVGFWLHPQARGRGVARACLRAVLEHGFADAGAGGLGLRRVEADADVTNRRSLRTLAGAGFGPAGLARRDRREPDGREADMVLLDILASDHRLLDGDRPGEAAAALRPPAVAARRAALLSLQPQVGRRLTLRAFHDGDADSVIRMLREPDIGPWSNPEAGWEAARDWIRAADAEIATGIGVRWAVVVDGRTLGLVRLYHIDGPRHGFRDGDPARFGEAELGYWLSVTARREGLMSRAVSLAVDHALRPLDVGGLALRRLIATTTPENLASQRILAAVGFQRWGVEPAADPDVPERWHYRYVPG